VVDPGPVATALWADEDLESQLRLDGIVTVVDGRHIERHLPSATAADETHAQPQGKKQTMSLNTIKSS
jgi:G3E family GTPase